MLTTEDLVTCYGNRYESKVIVIELKTYLWRLVGDIAMHFIPSSSKEIQKTNIGTTSANCGFRFDVRGMNFTATYIRRR